MIDNHIHIGQFKEIYYNPIEIIEIVMEKCDGLCFSSTTTCRKNITYSEVEKEISHTLNNIKWSVEIVMPFFWYAPSFTKEGIVIEKVMENFPYKGIKLHPLAHKWDLTNKKIVDVLHKIFGYAGQNNLPILIHTGHSGVDSANLFSNFFPLYPETKVILAHCRPLEEAISLIHNFPNVYGDTAFVEEEDLQKIIKENLSHKIILGSDFPVTNYFNNKYPSKYNNRVNSLKDQYDLDFKQLQYFSRLLVAFHKDC